MATHMVVNFVFGLLFVCLGLPLLRGKVRPNSYYGLRVGETMSDERVWYEANRFSGKEIVKLGVVTILATVGLAPILWSLPSVYSAVLGLVVFVGVLVVAWRSMSEARKISVRLSIEE